MMIDGGKEMNEKMEKVRNKFWVWTILFALLWVSIYAEPFTIHYKKCFYHVSVWVLLTELIDFCSTIWVLALVCGIINWKWFGSFIDVIKFRYNLLRRPE